MSLQEHLATIGKSIGDEVELEGLMRKNGILKGGIARESSDVLGFTYIVHWNNSCFEYYCANPPLKGCTQAVPVPCPVGIEVFNEYKVDYKEAVDIFHKGNWGSGFTTITLCKPLIYPQAPEPLWYFVSDLGVQVVIGADTGKVISPK